MNRAKMPPAPRRRKPGGRAGRKARQIFVTEKGWRTIRELEGDMPNERLWKVTYSMKSDKTEQNTLYVRGKVFTEAVAFSLSALKERHPLSDNQEMWEGCTAMLVEEVDRLVDPNKTVEIRHHDEVRL